MCKRQVIGPAMFVVGLLYLVVSALLFLVSSDLAGNAEATIAFDGANISSAVWLVLIAILMCPLSITGAYGAREHNKFCLCSFCTLTLVVIFTMWGVAGSLERMSVILDEKGVPISKEDTLRCLTSGLVGGPNITTASTSTASSSSSSNTTTAPVAPPPKIDNTVCTQMSSNAYVGRLRTLWVLLHDTAQDQLHKDSKIWNTFMVKLQKGTINGIPCCGFLRPAHCSGDSGETCSTQTQKNPEHTYYEKTQICNQGYGGCKFDKPMGICAYDELKPETSGCAFALMTWIQSQMNAVANVIVFFSLIPLLGWVYSMCMVLKRKKEDILPEIYTAEKVPPAVTEAIITKV